MTKTHHNITQRRRMAKIWSQAEKQLLKDFVTQYRSEGLSDKEITDKLSRNLEFPERTYGALKTGISNFFPKTTNGKVKRAKVKKKKSKMTLDEKIAKVQELVKLRAEIDKQLRKLL